MATPGYEQDTKGDNTNIYVESFIEKCASRTQLRRRIRKKRKPSFTGKSLADTIMWIRDNPEAAAEKMSENAESTPKPPKTKLAQLMSDYKHFLQIETKLGESVLESIENAKHYNKHIQRVFNTNSRESAEGQSIGSRTTTVWSEVSLPVSPMRTPDNISHNSHLSDVPEIPKITGDNSASRKHKLYNSHLSDVPERPTLNGDNSPRNENASHNSQLQDVPNEPKLKVEKSPSNENVSHNSHIPDVPGEPILKGEKSPSNENVSHNSHLPDVLDEPILKGEKSPSNENVSHNSQLQDVPNEPKLKVEKSPSNENVSHNSHIPDVPGEPILKGEKSPSNENVSHNSHLPDVLDEPILKGEKSPSNENVSHNSHLPDVPDEPILRVENSPSKDNTIISHNCLVDVCETPISKGANCSEINTETTDPNSEFVTENNNDEESVKDSSVPTAVPYSEQADECSSSARNTSIRNESAESRHDSTENVNIVGCRTNSQNQSLELLENVSKNDSVCRSLSANATETSTVVGKETSQNILLKSPKITSQNSKAEIREDSKSRSLKNPDNVAVKSVSDRRFDSSEHLSKCGSLKGTCSRSVSLTKNTECNEPMSTEGFVCTSSTNGSPRQSTSHMHSPPLTPVHSPSFTSTSNTSHIHNPPLTPVHSPSLSSSASNTQANSNRKGFIFCTTKVKRFTTESEDAIVILESRSSSCTVANTSKCEDAKSLMSASQGISVGNERRNSKRSSAKSDAKSVKSASHNLNIRNSRRDSRHSSNKSEDAKSLMSASQDLHDRNERRNSRRSSDKSDAKSVKASQDLNLRNSRRNSKRSSNKFEDGKSDRSASQDLNIKHERRNSNRSNSNKSKLSGSSTSASHDQVPTERELPNSIRVSSNNSEDISMLRSKSNENSNLTHCEQINISSPAKSKDSRASRSQSEESNVTHKEQTNIPSPAKSKDSSASRSQSQESNITHKEQERIASRMKRVQSIVLQRMSRQMLYDLVDNVDDDTYSPLHDLAQTLHNPLRNAHENRKDSSSVILPSSVSMIKEFEDRKNNDDDSDFVVVDDDDDDNEADDIEAVGIREDEENVRKDQNSGSQLELDSDLIKKTEEVQTESADVSDRTYQFIGLYRERAFTDPEIIQRKLRPRCNFTRHNINLETLLHSCKRETSPNVLTTNDNKNMSSEGESKRDVSLSHGRRPKGGDKNTPEIKDSRGRLPGCDKNTPETKGSLCLPELSSAKLSKSLERVGADIVKLPSIPPTVSKEYLRSKTCLRNVGHVLPINKVVDKYKQIRRLHEELESFRCYAADDSHVNVNVLQRCDNSYDVTVNWGAQNFQELSLQRTIFTKEENRPKSLRPSLCSSDRKRKPKTDFIYLDEPPSQMFYRQLTNRELRRFLTPAIQNASRQSNDVIKEQWELRRTLLARSKCKNFKRFFKGNVRSK